jgi:lysyl-tRNA synthetase class 1
MNMEKEYEFWPYKIAKDLIKNWKVDKQVITTGTSMSGDPHIGNASDVIRGDAIRLAVEKLGHKAELIWVSDDMDPFRSVPADMPKELENYLGIPAAMIPDLWNDGHKNFVEHFEEKFLKQLEKVKVKPIVMRGIDMYKSGMYNDVIKISMEKRREIAEILNKFRETKLDENWYPIDVICEKCGKISTTKILSYDEKKLTVEYFCNPEEILLHRKNPINGCGYKGEVSIFNGNAKLTWRVEWPARWTFLKTTCEPFGKEHAASGGSWDTGKEIVEKIFNYKAPYPVVYEHFLVNGQKMSKSKGNVISVDDMLKYMLPEHLRYWMFQGRLTIAKDIVIKNIVPHIFDEFDRAEEVYFSEKIDKSRESVNLRRAYEISVVNMPDKNSVIHIPFKILLNAVKLYPNDSIINVLSKEFPITADNVESLKRKIELVKNFARDFEEEKKLEKIELREEDKEFVKRLIDVISESNELELQQKIYNLAKSYDLGIKEFFKLIYKIILGSETGPRLGKFIIDSGKENIIDKLKSVL